MNPDIPPPAFTLSNVALAYTTPDGLRPVLMDLQLDIAHGEWVALVGRNGSGKSTLARIMAGLIPISRGQLRRPAAQDGRPAVQLIFQNPDAQIVGETVYEDICFGLENQAVDPRAMPARAYAALERVGLAYAAGRQVTRLSGGQKQLLCIAAALALDAAALIFDESTAMLDPLARQRVLAIVRQLHEQGTTIVWVTQLMEEVALADRVIALEQGRVAFDGPPERFFYSRDPVTGRTPCGAIGSEAPYVVQVAQQLLDAGAHLPRLPLVPQHLREVVRALWR